MQDKLCQHATKFNVHVNKMISRVDIILSHVDIIMSHVNIIMLHVNIIMSNVDIDKSYVNIIFLHVDIIHLAQNGQLFAIILNKSKFTEQKFQNIYFFRFSKGGGGGSAKVTHFPHTSIPKKHNLLSRKFSS